MSSAGPPADVGCTLSAMSGEPTLRDVLEMLAKLDAKIDRVDGKVDRVDGKVDRVDGKADAIRSEVVTVRGELATVRSEMRAGFDALDAELSKHADPTHRDLERRVSALEAAKRPPAPRRTPRARRG